MDLFMSDEDTPNKLMQLTLVFEYIEQDLHQFLHRYPKPSLPANEVKVCNIMRAQCYHHVPYLTNAMV